MREIRFIDSAYPDAHNIKEFSWFGRIDQDYKLWFDLHLKTDDYYSKEEDMEDEQEDEDQEEYTSDAQWKSKIVWDNYHCCTMSSSYWSDDQGILLSDAENKFSFSEIDSQVFELDKLPLADDVEYDDLAFGIYLLGHDTCANHTIQFTHLGNGEFSIKWTGNVALTYGGFYDFDHCFEASIENVCFEGFHYPQQWTQDQALANFSKVLVDIENWEFVDLNPKSFKREYKLMRKG
ncbi:hypothetical protein LNQ81_12600 [Myroides sp. M-43]|uniref:hypothetical protein n=1 Tax=Myroides oncorhynchi TaxID=2893756 RepID=UPI001E594BAC|nr:hypothetical protein [Myroides oncorhynchi]MCC9043512.1 hypothetical protein [Myroides oncorhynchi]